MNIGNRTYRHKAASILLAGIGGAILMFGVASRFPIWPSAWGPQTVLASSHYGIRGQAAPELKLDGWIDGNGNAMAPIRWRDYRGKVVYLYFFQDW